MIFVDTFENLAKKFQFNRELINQKNIITFVEDVLNNKIKPIERDIETKEEELSIKYLTKENFNSIVFDATKNVLVKFFTPWCHHCKTVI